MDAALEERVSGETNKIPTSSALINYIDNNAILYTKDQELDHIQRWQIKKSLQLPILIAQYWENDGENDLRACGPGARSDTLVICLAKDFSPEQREKFRPPLLITDVNIQDMIDIEGKLQTADGKIYRWGKNPHTGPDSTWAVIDESKRYDTVVDSVNGIVPVEGNITTRIVITLDEDENGNYFGKVDGEIKSAEWYHEQISNGVTDFVLDVGGTLVPNTCVAENDIYFNIITSITEQIYFIFSVSRSSIWTNADNPFLLAYVEELPSRIYATQGENFILDEREKNDLLIASLIILEFTFKDGTIESLYLNNSINRDSDINDINELVFSNINHKITLTYANEKWTTKIEDAVPIMTPATKYEAGKAGLVPAPPFTDNSSNQLTLSSEGEWINLTPHGYFNSKTLDYTYPQRIYEMINARQRVVFYDEYDQPYYFDSLPPDLKGSDFTWSRIDNNCKKIFTITLGSDSMPTLDQAYYYEIPLIPLPETATTGQLLRVSEVDENGVIIGYEADSSIEEALEQKASVQIITWEEGD